MEILLNRDTFRTKVFERDGYQCVICGEKAILNDKGIPKNLDAHHIIERRLFTEPNEFGGYFLGNGASLCSKHHIMAEETTLGCDEIREACGITELYLPDHFYFDIDYDKWGNIILPNGSRLKGDLFFDESVQKILEQGGVLGEFSKYWKYPRTYHAPWSQLGKDDRLMNDLSAFNGNRVIVTLKMDGENTSCYNDYIHARSINSGSHESRNWVKNLWAQFSYMLDDNMRICGENLYAQHTVRYDELETYFMMFSMWEDNQCYSWDETVEYSKILGLQMVPVIYDGIYDEQGIKEAFRAHESSHEGYVIRLAESFSYSDFRRSVMKYVKPEFRQAINNSHGHWISKKIIKNGLK